jgi:hypothetical protein
MKLLLLCTSRLVADCRPRMVRWWSSSLYTGSEGGGQIQRSLEAEAGSLYKWGGVKTQVLSSLYM